MSLFFLTSPLISFLLCSCSHLSCNFCHYFYVSLSLCGNSGSPLPLKPAGSLKKPIRLHSRHTVPHGNQQITAQALPWALRRRRAAGWGLSWEREIQLRKTRRGDMKMLRLLGSCQHVKSEIGMHSMSRQNVRRYSICRKNSDVYKADT